MAFEDSSMFTLDFANENDFDFSSLITPSTLVFQEPTNPCTPIIHCAAIQNDGTPKISEPNTTSEIRKGLNDDEQKNKRAKHKEVERQRRQEVSSLFKNLRYVLPSQYIKGKRSSSDHVEQAVNYIKDLQNKIKESSEKRDRLRRTIIDRSSTIKCSARSSSSSTCCCVGDTHITVVVRACLIGIEIVLSCCFRHKSLLSSVLELLAQEQCLNVVSCISTRLPQRFIHTIVSEVEEGKEVYFSELQENIMKMGGS